MSLQGTPPPIAQSFAGLSQAERAAAREAERKRPAKPSPARKVEDQIEVQTSLAPDAVRDLKHGSSEEATEDRTEHDKGKAPRPATERPRLDVKG